MVLNLYSCARRGVDIICALRAFNEAILVDERVRCGGRCDFGEGRHGCVFVGVCGRTGAPLSCGGVPVRLFGVLWRCPTLPQPVGCSTIGAAGLSFQVRNGGWAFPRCYDHHKCWCSTRSPTRCVVGGGVWVDRGLYSGCGFCCTARPLVGGCVLLFSVGPLVPVGSRAPRGASTSGLSTRSSGGGLSPHGGGVETSSWSRLPA